MNIILNKINKTFSIIKNINILYLLIVGCIFGIIAIISLRANNEHMSILRADVYSADQKGFGVQQALDNLQAYVTSNMNTSLYSGKGSVYPPIQLKYTYKRILQQEQLQVQQANSSLYTKAQNYCQSVDPAGFSGNSRVPCIESYISTNGVKTPIVPASLYEFDFISPSWSPDLAGWTLLLSIFFLFWAVLVILFRLAQKYL